jgi:hypothetical protein
MSIIEASTDHHSGAVAVAFAPSAGSGPGIGHALEAATAIRNTSYKLE